MSVFRDDDWDKPKHRPCACGCGELADECMNGRYPLAAFTIEATSPATPKETK